MTMSIGMNTNIEYQGKVYHAQTEDGGLDHPVITTLLFMDGVVYASKRTDYKDLLESPSCRETVAEMMKAQHKTIIRDLVSGRITGGEKANEKPAGASAAPKAAPKSPKDQAPQNAAPKTAGDLKTLDDLIQDYLDKKK